MSAESLFERRHPTCQMPRGARNWAPIMMNKSDDIQNKALSIRLATAMVGVQGLAFRTLKL